MTQNFTATYEDVRADLLAGREIALLDVREEDPHAQAHPLFAANLPFGCLELDAYTKLPRRDVRIVTLDGGEGLAALAAERLRQLGYLDVAVLAGGVDGWRAAGDWEKVKCMELLFVVGESNKSTAERLGITEQQVANFKFDFLERLRKFLKQQRLNEDVFPELHEK